jgi:MoaA/NifB/PqqE/SkfB family radical SAM enzyme
MDLAPAHRRRRRFGLRFRQAQVFAKAMASPRHPILAHLIPTRRCNLSCAYCNEYDDHSQPISTGELLRRVDRLASLGTTILTLSGGEPLLHPELDQVIGHIRSRGMIATLITNGYLLTPERIQQLNKAGLDHMEISIDNVAPDAVSKKSLKVLDRKLEWLARYAEFEVNINTVLGAGVEKPEDALIVARRAVELGFSSTVGLVHDHSGQLRALDQRHEEIYQALVNMDDRFFSYMQANRFQKNLARGLPNQWQCRAGSRYLYVCENGLVHWCSQQRGYPAIPLEQYTQQDLDREYRTVKGCAPHCTISCVHQTAILDDFRERPQETLVQILSPRHEQDAPFRLPLSLRFFSWAFLSSTRRKFFGDLALRILGVSRKSA